MQLYSIRRRKAWKTPDALKVTAARSAEIGDGEMSDRVRWIRSYVVNEDDGSAQSASMRRATLNHSASTPRGWECQATKLAPFPTPS